MNIKFLNSALTLILFAVFRFFLLGDSILLKQLIPSALTGVVIGKGGETITKLQAETGTIVKMSQGGDFYPG